MLLRTLRGPSLKTGWRDALAPRPWGAWRKGRPAAAHPSVGVEALEDLPAPVLVLALPREAVQVEQALHRLGA